MRGYILPLCLIALSLFCKASVKAQQRSNVEDFTITITFAQPPVNPPTIQKTPLKYNKDFALILQMDDGNPAIHDLVMPYFKGQNGNPGLFFTEGNPQNTVPFKMDAVHFSFSGLGIDVHNYIPGFLHWDNIINLWAGEFGIVNHGLSDPPGIDKELEVRRNASYTKRKTRSGTIPDGYDMNIFVVPNNDVSQIPFAKQNNLVVYHDGINSLQNPVRVQNLPDISGIEISRASITNNLFQQVQAIANQSGPGNNYIATFFNHGFGNVDITFDQFKTQMNQIAAAYGRNGLNNIWSASSSEVFEYLRLRELITVNSVLNENVLTITLSGQNLPQNFRYYAVTLVVEGESNIVNMVVQEPDNISTYLFSQNRALLNLKWNGRVIPDATVRAEASVLEAETLTSSANALVAMDYVQMLEDGTVKEQLRERLCALPGIMYEPGFCRAPQFLGADTTICALDTIIFTAPEAQSYLWSTGATTRSISIAPIEDVQIWARATYATGFQVSDTVLVSVWELPDVNVNPQQATIDPGTEITLTATGASSYIWSTSETTPQIVVAPKQSTSYWVDGFNQHGCKSRAVSVVEVVFTTTVDFLHEPTCLGDSTRLIALVQSNDSIVSYEWDILGSGLFVEYQGDTLYHLFTAFGEKLVGFRVKTKSGNVISKYNVVIVADKPVANYTVNGLCAGQPTLFTDKSTVAVGSIVSWVWATGDGNLYGEQALSYQYSNTGEFLTSLVATSGYGCSDTASVSVTIMPQPVIDLRLEDNSVVAPNQVITIPRGGSVTFKVNSVYDSIFWVETVWTPTFRVINAGTFYVDIYRNGCGNRRSFTVQETGGGGGTQIVGIMNLFTPNGDGFNDFWVIQDIDKISPARVAVFTRSGALVFQSNDYKNDWDGKSNGNQLPEGTYYYVIEGVGGYIRKGPLSILR